MGTLSLLVMVGCSPALKGTTAQVQFSMRPSAARSSALTYDANVFELSNDYCYAIHVTGDAPQLRRLAPSSNDLECTHGPAGLGLMVGAFKKGDVAEIEVPLGTKRVFDLLAIAKTDLPNQDCSGKLTAEVVSSSTDGHNVDLFYNGAAIDNDASTRLIARGTADVVPGVVNVELEALSSDPSGVEYGCHDGSSGGNTVGGDTEATAALRSGSYLEIWNPQTDGAYLNASMALGGSCSAVGTDVSINLNGTNISASCAYLTYQSNYDNKWYKEGRWNLASNILGSDGSKTATVTQAGNTHSATRTFNLDTAAPVIAGSATKHSTYITFAGTCEAGLPIVVESCSATASFTCPADLTTINAVCSSGNYSFNLTGSYSSAGQLQVYQQDDAGNRATSLSLSF